MVVKYGNIILLMETLINGICYKVSTDVLYRLVFLRHMNLPVFTADPSKCPSDGDEDSGKGKAMQEWHGSLMLTRKARPPES